MNNYAVIMAGGAGTRFWPKGTSKLPKQFLNVSHEIDTMVQQTYKRLTEFIPPQNIFIVTNANHKNEVRKQLPHLPEHNIIAEPIGRNTAPCIGLASLFIQQFDPKANVLVVPSDHLIKDTKEFKRIMTAGLKFVHEHGGIITLGITPTHPETGYGYIQFNPDESIDEPDGPEKIYKVKTFAEKPNLEVAKSFLDSGDFLWNSGMFIFRADTMMDEMKISLADVYESLMKLVPVLRSKDFDKTLEMVYSQIKSISIDYGIMEKSSSVYTIKSDFGWNDVGSWDEIYNISEKDSEGNVKKGRTVTINSKNNLIINDQKIAALIGVEDLLVIDTDNGLLICKRGDSQSVKEVVEYLRRKNLDQFL